MAEVLKGTQSSPNGRKNSGSKCVGNKRWKANFNRWQNTNEATIQRLNPSSTSSIPSKYQTFFTSSSEQIGFSSQTRRFLNSCANENPGPGTYSPSLLTLQDTTPFSKKGTGGFPSRRSRFPLVRSSSVGPASYNPVSASVHSQFNMASATRNFQKPVAVRTQRKYSVTVGPAPNEYYPLNSITSRNRLVTGKAAFNSGSSRVLPVASCSHVPGPGYYSPNYKVTQLNSCEQRSCFASGSKREINLHLSSKEGPGPADYFLLSSRGSLKKSNSLLHYQRKHHLCISAPAVVLPSPPPSPGPGHYEIQSSSLSDKKFVSGAVFKSTSSRWSCGNFDDRDLPGPGDYECHPVTTRRSFLYNHSNKWV